VRSNAAAWTRAHRLTATCGLDLVDPRLKSGLLERTDRLARRAQRAIFLVEHTLLGVNCRGRVGKQRRDPVEHLRRRADATERAPGGLQHDVALGGGHG